MEYQNKNLEYTNAKAYDKRGENSVLEKYVLGLWHPFLKNKISELSDGKIVADLGCGTCEYTKSADTAKKIYAVDISETMLRVCQEKMAFLPQVEIINVSACEAELPASDLVITIGIWEYINPFELFKKIKSITRPKSRVIVVFPNVYNKLNVVRRVFSMKTVGLRPGFIRKIFREDFILLESASFGMIGWFPKKLQFLVLPFWKLGDFIWRPFQKFLPLGINVYYLFEKK